MEAGNQSAVAKVSTLEQKLLPSNTRLPSVVENVTASPPFSEQKMDLGLEPKSVL